MHRIGFSYFFAHTNQHAHLRSHMDLSENGTPKCTSTYQLVKVPNFWKLHGNRKLSTTYTYIRVLE